MCADEQRRMLECFELLFSFFLVFYRRLGDIEFSLLLKSLFISQYGAWTTAVINIVFNVIKMNDEKSIRPVKRNHFHDLKEFKIECSELFPRFFQLIKY